MHSGDKASLIVYFTILVGEHCSHMVINRTLEHVHHNVLMISSKKRQTLTLLWTQEIKNWKIGNVEI